MTDSASPRASLQASNVLPVTEVATTDLSDMLDPLGGRRMDLPGFDPEFVDFPDYIIRITHRIWHDDPDRPRNVELCRRYYAENCVVHTQGGDVRGVQAVIDSTHATLESFPDRTLDADNVIWSDDGPQADAFQDSGNPVFYSSHLITSKMTNLGTSEFGPATGRRARVVTIADCACRDNVIFEEWLVRDYASLVSQMGHDVDATARRLALKDVEVGTDLVAFHAGNHARTLADPLVKPRVDAGQSGAAETRSEDFVRNYFHHIWNRKNPARLGDYYDFRVRGTYPGGRNIYGHDEIWGGLSALFEAVPDARVRIDHVADIPYMGSGRDIAVRWSLAGTHSGLGMYGEPTHAPVYIMGISHLRLIRGRIREEVTLWDDFAVRRMVEGARLRA